MVRTLIWSPRAATCQRDQRDHAETVVLDFMLSMGLGDFFAIV